jgi:hypothetical protein
METTERHKRARATGWPAASSEKTTPRSQSPEGSEDQKNREDPQDSKDPDYEEDSKDPPREVICSLQRLISEDSSA